MSDLHDLCHIYFKTPLDEQKYLNKDIDNKYCGFFGGWLLFFAKFCYLLLKAPKSFNYSDKQSRILFFGETINNQLALAPITHSLSSTRVIAISSPLEYPSWRQYLYAIPHLLTLIKEYRKSTEHEKKTIEFFFAKVWRSYGCRAMAADILDAYHPSTLVVANDHLPLNRAIMLEAKNRAIPTIYVQHAAITDMFPPLSYSYSFLDGLDSFEKYKRAGKVSGNVILSGGVRFDCISEYITNSNRECIGVAINEIDNKDIVRNLCLSLKHRYCEGGIRIVLRPHPSLPQEQWRSWCHDNDIEFSEARKEPSFAFLSKLKVMISNQSSIHLDAVMCHTPSVVYELASTPQTDFYNFVEKGLVRKCGDITSLIEFIDSISNFKFNVDVIRYFNNSFQSSFEGNVNMLIRDIIDVIDEDGRIDEVTSRYGLTKENKEDYCLYTIK